jgi:murein peptide amidase A
MPLRSRHPTFPRGVPFSLTSLTLVALAGCAGRSPQGESVSRVMSEPRPPVRWENVQLGRSFEGRPITMALFRGNHALVGPDAVLVIGGIHGNEPTSVDVARSLVDELRADPALATGHTVAVIVNANPDAYERRTRTNANGIDVNRNFPAANFKPARRRGPFRGGDTPASEPETRAILAAIEQIQPRLLISIHSIDHGRQCNNYDGPAEAIARLMEQHNGYPAAATIGYPTPGSLGSYAGIDRQIPTITLELPRSIPGREAWQANRAALLAAIARPVSAPATRAVGTADPSREALKASDTPGRPGRGLAISRTK